MLSVSLHISVLLVLVFNNLDSTPKPLVSANAAPMKPIQAVAVDKTKLQTQVNRLKKQKADAQAADIKRIRQLEERASTAKKKRSREESKIKTLDKQRKKKEREKKNADKAAAASKAKAKAADKVRKRKEAETQKAVEAAASAKAKRIKEEAAANKAVQLRKKQAAEDVRKAKEVKRKAKEAKELAAQQRVIERQVAEEMASRQQARRQQLMTEVERFTALITQTITGNLITDRSTMEGKSCKLTVSLAPSGFVTNVVLGKGDRIVCEAAKTAIYRAGTLPVSKNPEVFKEMSTINITVVPDFSG